MAMKKTKGFLIVALGFISLLVLLIVTPNSLGNRVKEEARARGYLEYTPMQAKKLAESRCSQCHDLIRIAKYCPRCGPPFIVVITHMRRLMKQFHDLHPEKKIIGLTKPQQIAVIQAWNAMVGNWEADFRREDLVTMIGKRYYHLLPLLDTPVKERKIEYGLMHAGVHLKGTYVEEGMGAASN